MSEADLDDFERLIEVPDRGLFRWITGEARDSGELRHAGVSAAQGIFIPTPSPIHSAESRLRQPVPPVPGPRARVSATTQFDQIDESQPSIRALDALKKGQSLTLASVPDGFDALVVADLARGLFGARRGPGRPCPRRARRAAAADPQERARFHRARDRGADLSGLGLPALRPRVAECGGHRAAHDDARAARPLARPPRTRPRILSTTVNALVQRVPPRARIAAETFSAAPGQRRSTPTQLVAWLETNGFLRTGTVRDAGEYAVRGGIIDLLPGRPAEPGAPRLLRRHARIDPRLRSGDAAHGRHAALPRSRADERGPAHDREHPALPPSLCGGLRRADARRPALRGRSARAGAIPGMEHWLPLFQDRLDTLFDYLPDVPVVFDALADDAAGERLAQVKDYYDARKARRMGQTQPGVAPYRPLPPDALYLGPEEWAERTAALPLARLTPFAHPGVSGSPRHRLRGAARPQLHRRARGREHQRVRGGGPPRPRLCRPAGSA